MSQQKLLAKVVKTLEDAGISYMLTGSIVSSFQGEPRSTHDIDIVVEISSDQVQAITSAFPDENYAFDEVAARNAIDKSDMFQLMEFKSGDKIDFWVLKDDLFDRTVFSRRYQDTILGVTASIPHPEDTILRKLKWAHDYESEKQFKDAMGVYELQFGKLDLQYIHQWIEALDLQSIWKHLMSEAQPLKNNESRKDDR